MSPTRAIIESCLAILFLLAAIVAAFIPVLFPLLFGSGSEGVSVAIEWAIVVALMLTFIMFSLLARRDFKSSIEHS